MTEERFEFTPGTKKTIIIYLIVGIILTVVGLATTGSGGDHHGEGHAVAEMVDNQLLASTEAVEATKADDEHSAGSWIKRLYANLWINNVYFTGLAIIGLFFVAIQYAASAGWSAGIKRIPIAMASWLPIAGILMLVVWVFGHHDIFHWTHTSLYNAEGADYDAIIDGKKGYFFWPMQDNPTVPVFFIARLLIFFGIWYIFFRWIRREMFAEDINGGTAHWFKMRKLSAIFLIIFAVTSSMAAWDWILSIDTHWFSTMFGWYVFASWWVTGLAFITLTIVLLKEAGYLKVVNSNHLHDLGKFIFAFSVFWTYIWFGQFLLIYYANIPEETVYFIERMTSSNYAWVFYTNLILNFFLPFLLLMTRDSKRHLSFLKLVCPIVIVGHWFDFYLMVTPGVMQFGGGVGLVEIGLFLVYGAAFVFITLNALSKAPLVAKNHPMMEESLHHHI